jgi:hypothetical protein
MGVGVLALLQLSTFIPESFSGGNMEIKSSAFADGGKAPDRYVMKAIGGMNVSLPFQWVNAPAGTKSFAFSIVDPHPVAKNWVHWIVTDIPALAKELKEGASGKTMPHGSRELENSYGDIGYGGPQPPKGTGDHPYVCTLYALNVENLNLPAETSLAAFKKALEGRVLSQAAITGNYGR